MVEAAQSKPATTCECWVYAVIGLGTGCTAQGSSLPASFYKGASAAVAAAPFLPQPRARFKTFGRWRKDCVSRSMSSGRKQLQLNAGNR